jgi:hypothetical protein
MANQQSPYRRELEYSQGCSPPSRVAHGFAWWEAISGTKSGSEYRGFVTFRKRCW